MPYTTVAVEALALWRQAVRRMDELPMYSPGWQQACHEAELAKQTYTDAVAAARAAQLPEPAPFEEAAAASQ
jgi:hypothetical protein